MYFVYVLDFELELSVSIAAVQLLFTPCRILAAIGTVGLVTGGWQSREGDGLGVLLRVAD